MPEVSDSSESHDDLLAQLDAAEQAELTRSAEVFGHQVLAFRRVLLDGGVPSDEVCRYVQAFIVGTMSSSDQGATD